MGNIVAIVGRPNVGKSTLFNRLTQSRQAIVDEFSGVTRDRHYGKADWQGQTFSLIDTGGYVHGSDDVFEAAIRAQVEIALSEADLIMFVVDTTTGITDLDETVASILRKAGKPVMLVANKVDNFERIAEAQLFYGLGLGEVFCLSSINGSGTGELLDALVELLPNKGPEEEEAQLPRIAVVGRPNVGKSSITNAFLGEERNIVTPIAGTTRDSIDTHYNAYGFDFILVDTAGLRKKSKVQEDLEFYSTLRSIRSIEKADVCLLMIDAQQGIENQDLHIYSLIQKNHKGVVILVNKWDLINKDNHTMDTFKEAILHRIAPFRDVPILFTSVPQKQRIYQALEAAVQVYQNRSRKISTSKLNDYLLPIIQDTPPPAYKGKYIKIKYITQLPIAYPAFALFCNLPQYVREPYKRFIENKLRERFDFTGVPMEIFFRKK